MSASPPPFNLPPPFNVVQTGYELIRDDLYPAVETGVDAARDALVYVEEEVIEKAVNKILNTPSEIASAIGDIEIYDTNIYDIIPNTTGLGSETQVRRAIESALGFDRRENEVDIVEGDNIPEQVTLNPFANDPAFKQRTLWNMLGEDGVQLTSGYTELNGNESPIFAPFSTYFPTSMWPYTAPDGGRYTVHNLANEPIESDFLGTKPIVEILMGRKLDKVGALPAFSVWGDIALGAPPVAGWLALGVLGFFTAEFWLPPILRATGQTVAYAGIGTGEIFLEVAKSLKTN